jgi:hypothetical protein
VRRYFTNAVYVLTGFARYQKALDFAHEGLDFLERAGLSGESQVCLHQNAASVLCALGRPGEAAELIGDRKGAYTSDSAAVQLVLAKIRLEQGAFAAAAGHATAMVDLPGLAPGWVVSGLTILAEIELWRGYPAAAVAAVTRARGLYNPEERIDCARLESVDLRRLVDAAPTEARAALAEAGTLLASLSAIADGGAGRLPEVDARVLTGIAEATRLTTSDAQAMGGVGGGLGAARTPLRPRLRALAPSRSARRRP